MKYLSLAFLITACSNSPAQSQDPMVSDATPAQAAEADKAPAETVEATAKTETMRQEPTYGPGAAPFHMPPPKVESATAVASEPTVHIEGCAVDGKGPSRGGPMGKHQDDSLTIKADGKTVVVTHFANHACCQKGVVTTEVGAGTVNVREVLDGKACRCMCSSTFTTSVPVAAGTYDVHVTLAVGEKVQEVGTQKVTVE